MGYCDARLTARGVRRFMQSSIHLCIHASMRPFTELSLHADPCVGDPLIPACVYPCVYFFVTPRTHSSMCPRKRLFSCAWPVRSSIRLSVCASHRRILPRSSAFIRFSIHTAAPPSIRGARRALIIDRAIDLSIHSDHEALTHLFIKPPPLRWCQSGCWSSSCRTCCGTVSNYGMTTQPRPLG